VQKPPRPDVAAISGEETMQRKIVRTKPFLYASLIALASQAIAPSVMAGQPLGTNDLNTKTPIRHVIVIYGENRSFDHVFGTYRSPSGGPVMNILSEGIVNADGTPGPNFAKAA
jgi:phospholipase C